MKKKILFKLIIVIILFITMLILGNRIYKLTIDRQDNIGAINKSNNSINELKTGKYVLYSYDKEKAIFTKISQFEDTKYIYLELNNELYDKLDYLYEINQNTPLLLIDNKLYVLNNHYTKIEDFKTNNDSTWTINLKLDKEVSEDSYIYSKLYYKGSVIQINQSIDKYDNIEGSTTKFFKIHNGTEYTIVYNLYEPVVDFIK